MKENEQGQISRCLACGGATRVRQYKHVEKVGRFTVTDETGTRPICHECGEVALDLDDLSAYQQRAAKTALLDGMFEGEVFRYARKSLGLTQKELGLLLGFKAETISRWENNNDPFEQSQALAMVAVLDEALCGTSPRQLAERMQLSTGGTVERSEELTVLKCKVG